MIDTKKRLIKLLKQCKTYEQFERLATSKSSWVLAPYVAEGHSITRPWLLEFYMLNKGSK